MFNATVKNRISEVTTKIENKFIVYLDSVGVAIAEQRVRKAEEKAIHFQGQAAIYLNECVKLNRVIKRKCYSIKRLRAKIERMNIEGIEDPDMVHALKKEIKAFHNTLAEDPIGRLMNEALIANNKVNGKFSEVMQATYDTKK